MADADFICVRCATGGQTCCQVAQVLLTQGDVRRIEAATEGDAAFYETALPADPDYAADADLDPIWFRAFDAEGRRRVLRHQPNGDCVFLGDRGCRLEATVRPLVCRLYPYDYNHETLKGVNGHLCPPPEKDNAALLLALLGMERSVAERERQQLYQELREEFPD